ncbi:MAG: imidazolonepropionase, partial [Bdellovibrionaceae bacterium]|nr:imidazolonepropionase [Pseudobdellovibrionaceae bacterium]
MAKLLVRDISELVSLSPAMKKRGRNIIESDLGIEKDLAIYIDDGKICWLGPKNKIPKALSTQKKIREISAKGKLILPGFVECHTHTVFAGNRAAEFEMRNQGVSYLEIAKRGGGILSTMRSTREASPKSLLEISQKRVDEFVAQGVTTLEIKSGYGLDLKNEIKMLKTAKAMTGPEIVTTFLGAHAKPPEFESYKEYLNHLGEQVLPVVKKQKLATRVDIFVEAGFFDQNDSREFLQKAKGLGFQIAIHADQLTLSGGANLAVELGALSGDHLLQIGEKEMLKLAKSEVTCVLLPASDLYMKCAYPNARKLIDSGARVALATDFNPGSCPTQDLNLVGLLARLEMKMSLPEVIAAYTVGAAFALNLQDRVGSVDVGKDANFICTEHHWSELFYSAGQKIPDSVY